MKVKDGIIGLIVGDALGVPVEFSYREDLEDNPVTRMEGYGTYNQPPGTWSDDSSMTIATMTSIINKKGIDYADIMDEFCNWVFEAEYTPYNEVFDIGITTRSAIGNYYYKKTSPLDSGLDGERDNGNGSLMRILPLAYIKDIDYETVENVSALTHAHKRSKIACVLYIEMARSMLVNDDMTIDEHIRNACDKIKEYYKDSEELAHFKRIFNNDLTYDTVSAKGYVITTFESVVYALKNGKNYKDTLLKAVNLGRDTDTVGAICGGLAGIYYGFDDIPIDWVGQLAQIDCLLELCEKYEAFCDESH